MNFSFTNETPKESVFTSVKDFLEKKGFTIAKTDSERPWGGFFVIDEKQSDTFKKTFFESAAKNDGDADIKLSPKNTRGTGAPEIKLAVSFSTFGNMEINRRRGRHR